MAIKKLGILFLSLCFSFTTFATQRNGNGSAEHNRPPTHRPMPSKDKRPRPDQGRDGRRFDRNNHHRIDTHHIRVNRYGSMEFFWGGYWFGCNTELPYWVFRDEIWIEIIGSGVYIIYVYHNPAQQIQIFIVE